MLASRLLARFDVMCRDQEIAVVWDGMGRGKVGGRTWMRRGERGEKRQVWIR